MRVLVLGGTHFIGPHVVRRLLARGAEVAVFHRGKSEEGVPPAVAHVHGDRRKLAEHAGALREFAPDAVVDMIAMTEEDGRSLVAAFRGVARRLVVVSSADVYRAYDRFRRADPGPPDPLPLTEDSPLREKLYPYRSETRDPDHPLFSYDKILVERAVREDPSLPATVLRLPMVYGPGDRQRRIHEYLKPMEDGRGTILLEAGLAAWRGIRGYVEDMAEAIVLSATDARAAGRTYHLAEDGCLAEADWVRRIGQAAGWTGEVQAIPERLLPRHLRHEYDTSQHWVLDTSRIRRELGYAEPTPPEEAMRRTVAWEREQPPAERFAGRFDYPAEDAALTALRALG